MATQEAPSRSVHASYTRPLRPSSVPVLSVSSTSATELNSHYLNSLSTLPHRFPAHGSVQNDSSHSRPQAHQIRPHSVDSSKAYKPYPQTHQSNPWAPSQREPSKCLEIPSRTPPPMSHFSYLPPQGDPHPLTTGKRDKERLEDMSAVFSLLTATDRLENVWARRGAISQEEYEKQCEKLIQQYNVLRPSTESSIPDLDLFISEYDCKASMARHRLKVGVPATVTPLSSVAHKPKDLGKYVVRCTANFYELVNSIELGQHSVSTLLPSVVSLCRSLDNIIRVAARGKSYEFVIKLVKWRDRLYAMPAHATLSEEDASRLKLDLNTSYEEFENVLND